MQSPQEIDTKIDLSCASSENPQIIKPEYFYECTRRADICAYCGKVNTCFIVLSRERSSKECYCCYECFKKISETPKKQIYSETFISEDGKVDTKIISGIVLEPLPNWEKFVFDIMSCDCCGKSKHLFYLNTKQQTDENLKFICHECYIKMNLLLFDNINI